MTLLPSAIGLSDVGVDVGVCLGRLRCLRRLRRCAACASVGVYQILAVMV